MLFHAILKEGKLWKLFSFNYFIERVLISFKQRLYQYYSKDAPHRCSQNIQKKLEGNYTRIPWTILNKSWKQHPTNQQLYDHLSPISKTIQVRWTRDAEHCWRSKDKLMSNVLLWILTQGCISKNLFTSVFCRHWMLFGRPAESNIW